MAADAGAEFDPRGLLQVLERHRVAYVVIGALARVLHGTDEVTGGVDICPQRRGENLERLDAALAELGAAPVSSLIAPERADPQTAGGAVIRRDTHAGVLQVVAVPEEEVVEGGGGGGLAAAGRPHHAHHSQSPPIRRRG